MLAFPHSVRIFVAVIPVDSKRPAEDLVGDGA
jgi:hypothetical protein